MNGKKEPLVILKITCSGCKATTDDKTKTHCSSCGERLTREWIKKETDNPYDT